MSLKKMQQCNTVLISSPNRTKFDNTFSSRVILLHQLIKNAGLNKFIKKKQFFERVMYIVPNKSLLANLLDKEQKLYFEIIKKRRIIELNKFIKNVKRNN